MTLLFNAIPALICLLWLGSAYYLWFIKKNLKGLVISVVITVLALVVYQNVQPSYLPKNGVPPLKSVDIYSDKDEPVIQDRLKQSSKSSEQHQEDLDSKITWKQEVDTILNK